MVKIFEDAHIASNGDGGAKSKIESSSGDQNQAESDDRQSLKSDYRSMQSVEIGLPAADLDLVGKLRTMLKDEYEHNDKAKEIYSQIHYDDLMDADSPNTCWRYLLHCEQDVDAAFKLIKSALAWRKESRCDELKAEDLSKDIWLMAPIGFTGRSRSGHDVVYAVGKNFRKPDASLYQTIHDFITFLVWSWDRKHKHDLDQFELVFDVSDTGFRNIDVDFAFWLVSIRDFIPARVKCIYIVGIPFLIRPIIKMIISWLPERYSRLVKCGTVDELIKPNIDEEYIPEEAGGKSDSRWRLAPIETKWLRENKDADSEDLYKKICKACTSNTPQEYIDRVYQMQRDYEREQLPNKK